MRQTGQITGGFPPVAEGGVYTVPKWLRRNDLVIPD